MDIVEFSTGRATRGRAGHGFGRAVNRTRTWTKFKTELLTEPGRSAETVKQYFALPKAERDVLKSVPGWYLGGPSIDGARKKVSIPVRTLITLDFEGFTHKETGVTVRLDRNLFDLLDSGLHDVSPWRFIAHTTRSHTAEAPRFRVIFQPDRPLDVASGEFNAVSRILAAMIDPTLDCVDPKSFQCNQLMFRPSLCRDSEWRTIDNPGEAVDADRLLAEFEGDWRDPAQLPESDKRTKARAHAAKAEDPTEKEGAVGDFCRAYGIDEAIEHFELPYINREETGPEETRYTYAHGSTAHGAVVYENKFLYSHHQTDPCADTLCNSFDLVRRHKFGDLDKDDDEGDEAKITTRPSYKAMMKLCSEDESVQEQHRGGDDDIAFDPGDIEMVEPESEDGTPTPKKRTALENMNLKHAVVMLASGKVSIATFRRNDMGHKDVSFSSRGDMAMFYESRRMLAPKGNTDMPISEWWLRQRDRREYKNGATFAPGKDIESEGRLNLWRGWGVTPIHDDSKCARFLDHVRDIACAGDEEHARWFMAYLAHIVQRPYDKPGTGIAVRSDEEGAGKDIVFDYFERILGKNFSKVRSMHDLTGQFNANQAECLLLHCEEAFWAGSKQDEGPLKSLITARVVPLEKKGIDKTQIASYLRVVVTSNKDWVIKADRFARRWFVLEASPRRVGDRDYFDALVEEMEGDGPAALLGHLMRFDLTGIDVRTPPKTAALAQQKIESFEGPAKWWHEMLDLGELNAASDDIPEDLKAPADPWTASHLSIPTKALHALYAEWWKENRGFGQGMLMSETMFGIRLRKFLPSVTRKQIGYGGPYHYIIPPLAQCRDEFAAYAGSEITWGDGIREIEDEDYI